MSTGVGPADAPQAGIGPREPAVSGAVSKPKLNPDLLIRAYAAGIFPMAEARGRSELFWVDPEYRGILPLEDFHVPRRLRRTVRADLFTVTCDRDFAGVIEGCAESKRDRPDTWISEEIVEAYRGLYQLGFAHSVECWQDDRLVGGLYGVSLAGAFFGESMFSRCRDASKVALVHLVARLTYGGYRLLDTQFTTPHLEQFGVIEIPRARYRQLLDEALDTAAEFPREIPPGAVEDYLQSITQTS